MHSCLRADESSQCPVMCGHRAPWTFLHQHAVCDTCTHVRTLLQAQKTKRSCKEMKWMKVHVIHLWNTTSFESETQCSNEWQYSASYITFPSFSSFEQQQLWEVIWQVVHWPLYSQVHVYYTPKLTAGTLHTGNRGWSINRCCLGYSTRGFCSLWTLVMSAGFWDSESHGISMAECPGPVVWDFTWWVPPLLVLWVCV